MHDHNMLLTLYARHVSYSLRAIKYNRASNKGEMYNEVRKAFGTLSSYSHGTMLSNTTFGN